MYPGIGFDPGWRDGDEEGGLTYYRIGFFDIFALALTGGFWVLWIIFFGDRIDIPAK